MSESAPNPSAFIGFRDIHTPVLDPMAQLGDMLAAFGVALVLVSLAALLVRRLARGNTQQKSPLEILRDAQALEPSERLVVLEHLLRRENARAVPDDARDAFYRPGALDRLDEIEAMVRQHLDLGRA